MKKVLIVLLSVLLALSFVSCESDKSEEIIAVYNEYRNGLSLWDSMRWSLGYDPYTDAETTLAEGTEIEDTYYLRELIELVEDVTYAKNATGIIKSGKITVKSEENGNDEKRTVVIKDAVIEATYTDYYGDKENKNITLKLNGTYDYSFKAETNVNSYSYDLKANDISFEIASELKESLYTSAEVNGKAVNLKLVNGK